MRVRLTRKLAERVDGIDLSAHAEGDWLDLSRRDAELLLAEGWATPTERRRMSVAAFPSQAADRARHPRDIQARRRADDPPRAASDETDAVDRS